MFENKEFELNDDMLDDVTGGDEMHMGSVKEGIPGKKQAKGGPTKMKKEFDEVAAKIKKTGIDGIINAQGRGGKTRA